MKYYRISEQFGKIHLCVETSENELTSLTSINKSITDYKNLLDASDITNLKIDDITKKILSKSSGEKFKLSELIESSINKTGPAIIIKPIDPEEMWAGGFGNMIISKEDLEKASDEVRLSYNTPNISTTLYKGTNHRLVGPFEKVGIRTDTVRTIAEGEIIFIIYKGKFVGISLGNEVAGDLATKANVWTVPAKVFKGCASIGPCILSMEDENENNKPLELKLEINQYRNDELIGSGSVVTKFKRSPVDIVESTVAHDTPPDLVIQYSGGFAIARKDDELVPLKEGDSVFISLEGVGHVQNEVEEV
jgi:2-dehydro-3-deoxy-D-arabinonate dehydratase